jgi:basic membrane protein A and related proteins
MPRRALGSRALRLGVSKRFEQGNELVNGNFLRLLVVAVLALCIGTVAACGDDEEPSGSGGSATSEPQKKIKIGLVTDIGGLNDHGFNALAYKGLKQAESELGAEIRVITSTKVSDYVPNLSALARQKFDLIVANGFLMGEATEKIANAFPTSQFAIIDFSQGAMKSKPKNVTGLIFKEAEGGYLVGYMAGLHVKDKGGEQVISAVGGQSVPAVDAYIAGYQAGSAAANPKVKVLYDYSEDFVDQAKCKELGLKQIGEGSQVVFAAAGNCGLGALDAAKQKGMQGIGVDADQGYLGDQMMTSALKKVDLAVFTVAKELQEGKLKGGSDQLFDAKSGGMGLGKTNDVGSKYADKVDAVLKKIQSGEISDIPITPTK